MTCYRNPTPPKDSMMRKSKFFQEPEADGYRCPEGQLLPYATTDRSCYKHYRSDISICRDCPLLASCTTNAKTERTITRHVWQDARERTDAHRKTARGKAIYKRRKKTVERSFADAKQLHEHRYALFRALIRSDGSACWPRLHKTSGRLQWQSRKHQNLRRDGEISLAKSASASFVTRWRSFLSKEISGRG